MGSSGIVAGSMMVPSKSSTADSEDGFCDPNGINANIKKPLIAKWKAGVKLQVTGRSENHGKSLFLFTLGLFWVVLIHFVFILDLMEGLKRAQRSRLEDQRGTEINFELPDFLKDKENFNNNKFRKIKRQQNGNDHDVGGGTTNDPIPLVRSNLLDGSTGVPPSSNLSVSVRPQPAPRLSINLKNQYSSVQCKINELEQSFGSPKKDLSGISNIRQYSPRLADQSGSSSSGG